MKPRLSEAKRGDFSAIYPARCASDICIANGARRCRLQQTDLKKSCPMCKCRKALRPANRCGSRRRCRWAVMAWEFWRFRVDGRPIKVEGNPRHPASLGATDAFAEAAVLSLYDPDRSRTPTLKGSISSWDAFSAALLQQLEKHDKNGGDGLRLLTGRVTSPTLLRQIDGLLTRYPQAMWHVHEPIDETVERQGTILAFGRALHPLPRLEKAEVMLCLDADPLGPGPSQSKQRATLDRSQKSEEPSQFLAVLCRRERAHTHRNQGRPSLGAASRRHFRHRNRDRQRSWRGTGAAETLAGLRALRECVRA